VGPEQLERAFRELQRRRGPRALNSVVAEYWRYYRWLGVPVMGLRAFACGWVTGQLGDPGDCVAMDWWSVGYRLGCEARLQCRKRGACDPE
jgi:hypothetical protein